MLNVTTISVITAPVYQLENDGQNQRLSDYEIDSAAIGAIIGMVTAVVASLVAAFIFSQWIALCWLVYSFLKGAQYMLVLIPPGWRDEGKRSEEVRLSPRVVISGMIFGVCQRPC